MSRTGVARPAFPANLRKLQLQFATEEAYQQYLTGRAPTTSRRIRHPLDVMAHGGEPQHVGAC